MSLTNISQTELHHHTRKVVDQAQRESTLIISRRGEDLVVIMDVLDYRLLRALAAFHSRSQEPSPFNDQTLQPEGLSESELAQTKQDAQTSCDRVLTSYLSGNISLGRAAKLLGISRFEFANRLNRLGIPLRLGPQSVEEARAEFEALQR